MPSLSGLMGRRPVLVLASVLSVLFATGCGLLGDQGLTGASTCDEFIHASPQDQQAVTVALAGEYRKPDFATPLGIPAVPYFCAKYPDVTLDEFFASAG